jgi:hypothetical protein
VQIAIKLATSSAIFQKLRNSLTGTASISPTVSGAEQLQLRSSEGRSVMHPVSNVPAMPEVAEDEVLENERFMPFQGFKSSHLMGLDPKRCCAMLWVCAIACCTLHRQSRTSAVRS